MITSRFTMVDKDAHNARVELMRLLSPRFTVTTTLFDEGVCLGVQVETPAGYQMDFYFGHRSYENGVGNKIWNPALKLDSTTLKLVAELCQRCLIA
jgi:hypothetical protein